MLLGYCRYSLELGIQVGKHQEAVRKRKNQARSASERQRLAPSIFFYLLIIKGNQDRLSSVVSKVATIP